MATVTCKTAYWQGGPGYNCYSTLTAESRFLTYNIRHRFFRPASVVVVLDDAGGVSTQKYIVDPGASPTKAYVGSGWLTIEEDAVKLWDLRVLDAIPDHKEGTLNLLCEDWMSQLADPLCQYDTRQDLGSGVRESTLVREDAAAAAGNAHCYYSGGNGGIYDNGKAWTVDGLIGYHLLFSGRMAGAHSITVHPYDETVTPSSAPMVNDTPADGETRVVVQDLSYHLMSDTAYWTVEWPFLTQGQQGAVTAYRNLKITVWFKAELSSCPSPPYTVNFNMGVYNWYNSTWDEGYWDWQKGPAFSVSGTGTLIDSSFTWTVPAYYLDGSGGAFWDMFGAGVTKFRLRCYVYPTGAQLDVYVDRVAVSLDITSNVDSGSYEITDNDASQIICSGVDFVTKGIWETCPYCVTKQISDHVNPLVTAYDPLKPLATNVDATSVFLPRHHNEQTPLAIITQWAQDAGAVVWCYLDGSGNPTVRWKYGWTPPAPGSFPYLLDTNVLRWEPRREWSPVCNEYHGLGIRAGPDAQIYIDTSDLGTDPGSDSKTLFGVTRAKSFANQGLYTQADAEATASALVERDEDMQLVLVAHIAGRLVKYGGSSYDVRLGSYVTVTSTYLNLSAVGYWVIDYSYDMLTDELKLVLHPDVTSDQFVDFAILPEILRGVEHLRTNAQEAARQIYPAPSWSETW